MGISYSKIEESILKIYLQSQYKQAPLLNNLPQKQEKNIQLILEEFDGTPLITSEESVIEFWTSNKWKHPELYCIAEILFAVPSTEVSVERKSNAIRYTRKRPMKFS